MARRPSKRVVKKPRHKRRGPRRPARQTAPRPAPLASRASTNLPIQITSFVGREREIEEIKQALLHTRLLTLIGAGGCGKTRLALRMATDVLAEYPDGVWVAELAPLSDPALVPKAVATALDLPEQPGRSLTETLKDTLRPKSLLLVLDNCEHLVTACAELAAALLRTSPTLRILTTSREPLGLPGEIVWRVSSLSVPDLTRLPPPEHLGQFDAIRLFVDRAATSKPGFAITGRNATAIAQVCHQLEGIPLAIELAAARVKVLTMDQIAARLDDRFRLLTGGSRTSLARHQTLRGTMDWSYGLLSKQERTVLRRLSVFAGGWIVDAAEAVCSGAGLAAMSILDLVTSLADKSLVIAETHGREARYRMLETVRQYAHERLLQAGEEAEVRTRHRVWYLDLAERAEARIYGPEQTTWLERLEVEHDNLRAALGWSSTEEEDAEIRVRLAAALYRFWHYHTHWGEGRKWLETALARSREFKSTARVRALHAEGVLAYRQGDYGKAMALHEQSLTLARELGDQKGIALALLTRGIVTTWLGDLDAATALIEESLEVSRKLEDKWVVALVLAYMGMNTRRKGDYAKAGALCEESLALFRMLGDKRGIAMALCFTGHAVRLQGNLERAAGLYRESLTMFGETGDKWVATECIEGLALIARAQRNGERAARLFGAAEAARGVFGVTTLRPEAGDQEQFWVALRERPEGTRFAAAWAEGQAMTLEQAIEEALAAAEVQRAPKEADARTLGARADILTAREREVATLIAQGLTNREIASELQVMERTAETHVRNILNKLTVNSRTQIAVWAIAHGLQSPVLER
jgi:predicted ATPase/DNA-binding CsgD family transcriptional regulator